MSRNRQAGAPDAHAGLKRAVVFSLAATVLSGTLLFGLLALLPDATPRANAAGSVGNLGHLLAMTTAAMFLAGVFGACLYNFRGLIKHSTDDDYHARYNLSYYLRPVSGGVSGVIVFFLLLGGAMTLNVGNANAGAVWTTLAGRLPYVAFSLLAGYGSNEFMAKLKDLAESLFALKKKE
jgi:hypothetical protein